MSFAPLISALDKCADAGRAARFWWRDDDAVAPAPALDRLLALSARTGAPLALAVIPAHVQPALAARLADEYRACVLTHGWSHVSHAPPGEKNAEFGAHRPVETMLAEAAAGRTRIEALFGSRAVSAFAPPWNRIAPALAARLAEAGFSGLSSYGPRPAPAAGQGVAQTNAHCDPIDWRGGRSLIAPETLISALAHRIDGQLRDNPTSGREAAEEATGLLTHHLVHDAALWGFVEALLETLRAHPAAQMIDAREAFAVAPASPQE